MGAVDLAPLIEQSQDLGLLLRQDAVHRRAARGLVGEVAASPAGQPAMRPDLPDLQHTACAADRPATGDRVVEQAQQAGLGGRIDTAWDTATQPQPPFPSTSVSFTASSLQASESRAISALACSSS